MRLSRRDQKQLAQRLRVRRATLGLRPVNDSSLKGLQHHVSRLNPKRRLRCKLFRTALKSGGIHLEMKRDDDAPPGSQCKFEPCAPAKSQSKLAITNLPSEFAQGGFLFFNPEGGTPLELLDQICHRTGAGQTNEKVDTCRQIGEIVCDIWRWRSRSGVGPTAKAKQVNFPARHNRQRRKRSSPDLFVGFCKTALHVHQNLGQRLRHGL